MMVTQKRSPILSFLSVLISALLLQSCSQDDNGQDTIQNNELTIVSFTRAEGAMTVEDDYSPLSLFLVDGDQIENEKPSTLNGRFIYKANETIWKSSINVIPNHHYAIYGYAPADAVTANISNQSLTGATLTFTNLPAVSSQDICFVVGVQDLETTTEIPNPKNIVKNIPLGQFGFEGKTKGEDEKDRNFANLLMDHVYASICFKVEIDAEYDELRDIKLRGMKLQSTKATAKATVTLAANTENTSPVVSATYSDLAGTDREAQFFDSDTGVELTAGAALQATCCFVPTLANDLTLITTYDVYDRYGKKISERTATNKLPNITISRGERMTMTLTVVPTYLYVLSDKDLDNPTIKIN